MLMLLSVLVGIIDVVVVAIIGILVVLVFGDVKASMAL